MFPVSDMHLSGVCKCGCQKLFGSARVEIGGMTVVVDVGAGGVGWPHGIAPKPEIRGDAEKAVLRAWLSAVANAWGVDQ